MYTILARTNVMPVIIERDGVKNTYQLVATVNEGHGLKLLNLDPRDHPEVMDVISGGALIAGGHGATGKQADMAAVLGP
jgi:hypothetical protein